MNVLDIIIAIPLCFFIFRGWKRGVVFELTMLLGLVAGCWAATHLTTWVADALKLQGEVSVLVAFLITFLGALVGAYMLGKAVEGVLKMVKAEMLNHLIGAMLGMAKCLCVLGVLLSLVVSIDKKHIIITPETQEQSVLYKPTYAVGNKLVGTVNLRIKV